jgi:hypothetical protein
MDLVLFGPDGGCGTYKTLDGVVLVSDFRLPSRTLWFHVNVNNTGPKDTRECVIVDAPEILKKGMRVRVYYTENNDRYLDVVGYEELNKRGESISHVSTQEGYHFSDFNAE